MSELPPEDQPNPETPASQDSKEQLVAELYGALERKNHVSFEMERYDLDLWATGGSNVIISHESDDRSFVIELDLTVLGAGRHAEVFAKEVITPQTDEPEADEAESGRTERQLETEAFEESVGLGTRPATEEEVRLAVDLIRKATEIGRSDL